MKPNFFSAKNIIFKNRYLELYSIIADFGSFIKEYFVTKTGTRVGIILEKDDSILLVDQYRYAINDYSWELPSGEVNEGESLEDAIIRECLEETGIRCNTLNYIYDFILNVDIIDCLGYIYNCKDFSKIANFDKKEIKEIRWFPYKECLKMILSKEIRDIFTVIGLLVYGFKDKKLKLKIRS